MKNCDLSEDSAMGYVKRKHLLHLFGLTVIKKKFITVSLRASDTVAIVSVLTQIWGFLIDSFLSSEVTCFLLTRAKSASLFASFKPVVPHSSLFIQCVYILCLFKVYIFFESI